MCPVFICITLRSLLPSLPVLSLGFTPAGRGRSPWIFQRFLSLSPRLLALYQSDLTVKHNFCIRSGPYQQHRVQLPQTCNYILQLHGPQTVCQENHLVGVTTVTGWPHFQSLAREVNKDKMKHGAEIQCEATQKLTVGPTTSSLSPFRLTQELLPQLTALIKSSVPRRAL